jgi:hypothetical protein
MREKAAADEMMVVIAMAPASTTSAVLRLSAEVFSYLRPTDKGRTPRPLIRGDFQ